MSEDKWPSRTFAHMLEEQMLQKGTTSLLIFLPSKILSRLFSKRLEGFKLMLYNYLIRLFPCLNEDYTEYYASV